MSIDLTSARAAVVSELMPDTYSITRTTSISDGGGGFTEGTTTTLTGPCGFAVNNGQLEQSGDQVQQRGSYRIRVPIDADIRPTDPIQIFGRTFRIVWTPPVSALSLFRRIGLEEVSGGA